MEYIYLEGKSNYNLQVIVINWRTHDGVGLLRYRAPPDGILIYVYQTGTRSKTYPKKFNIRVLSHR